MIILIKKIFNYQKIFSNLILLVVGLCLMFPAQSENFSYFQKENNQSSLELQTTKVEKDAKIEVDVFLTNLLDENQFAYNQNQASYSQNEITLPFNFYSWSQAP
jgi:type III secretory pathway component EscR